MFVAPVVKLRKRCLTKNYLREVERDREKEQSVLGLRLHKLVDLLDLEMEHAA